ncbi:MAG: murein biosynthesis integral membrane protein MurJ [Prochloraceae cyanobacterium]
MSIRMRDRLLKKLRSKALVVMIITFFGMLFGLLVDILTAARFGNSQTADALIIALSFPRLIDTVSREGTKFSLVPLFIERKEALSSKSFNHFASGIFNLSLISGITLTIFCEIFASIILIPLAPGLSPEAFSETVFLFRVCAPLIIFAPGIAVLSVLLNSQKHFYMVAFRNAVAPSFMVAAYGFAWNAENVAFWVVLSFAIGFAVFLITLFFDARRILGHQHQWLAIASKEDLVRLWGAGFLPTIGFIFRQTGNIISRQSLVTLAAPPGGVAIFYFATRLFAAAQNLIGVSIVTTSLPAMTEHDLAGNRAKLAAAIRKNLADVLIVTLPAVFLIVFFNEYIINLIYQRGNFSAEDVKQTSEIFFWLGWGLIFTSLVPVLNSGLYAQRAYNVVFKVMVSMTFVGVILSWIFLQWKGLAGVAIAISLNGLIAVLTLIYCLSKTGISLTIVPRKKANANIQKD